MNNQQKYLALRDIDCAAIATALGLGYHTVQKVIKGHRQTPSARAAIAEYLGLDAAVLWGDAATLRQLLAQEIDRKAASERTRLRARFLRRDVTTIPKARGACNG
jgi:plasmid maintenance system antidote protein VapI